MPFLVPNNAKAFRITGDFTTASLTAVSVIVGASSLSFQAAANTSYMVTVFGTQSKDAGTAGIKMQVTAPVGSTVRGNWFRGVTAAATALQNEVITAINTLSSNVFGNVAVIVFPFRGEFVVNVGATEGTVALGVASVTSGTLTIQANSGMSAIQI